MGKMIGGIFLVVGISIGAAILALPVTTAPSGFIPATLLMFACWAFMTFNAFLVLEANLWLPENSNMISMAKTTLGLPGQILAWFSYCALLYSLLAAYIAAGSDVFGNLLLLTGIHTSSIINSLLFVGILGFVVYRGIKLIDYVNRALILIKLGSFLLLMLMVSHYVQWTHLQTWYPSRLFSCLLVAITAFGFASIVPSLRVYFHGDTRKLRRVILTGSLITLFFNILWVLVILGSLPLEGANGLLAVLHSGKTTSQLIMSLSQLTQNGWVMSIVRMFTSFSVATSFLGVALSLSDFLADGLHLAKKGWDNCWIYTITFLPPLLIVLFYPGVFIAALNYAGTFCGILIALLPTLMVWFGRYHKNMPSSFRVFGGKPLIIISFIGSCFIVGFGIIQEFHLIAMDM